MVPKQVRVRSFYGAATNKDVLSRYLYKLKRVLILNVFFSGFFFRCYFFFISSVLIVLLFNNLVNISFNFVLLFNYLLMFNLVKENLIFAIKKKSIASQRVDQCFHLRELDIFEDFDDGPPSPWISANEAVHHQD